MSTWKLLLMTCKHPACLVVLLMAACPFALGAPQSSGDRQVQTPAAEAARRLPEFAGKHFRFQPARGIGREEGITRRDVSDVIRVGVPRERWQGRNVSIGKTSCEVDASDKHHR
jgi:hypothetical protein